MIIVYTTGTFDMLHIGHLRILERAKALGDKLIVGVSTDDLVESYKGHRPVIPFEQRLALVSALRCVDVAVPQYDLDKTEALRKIGADVLVVGDDWTKLQGEEYMRAHGKKVIYLPRTPGISSTILRTQGDIHMSLHTEHPPIGSQERPCEERSEIYARSPK